MDGIFHMVCLHEAGHAVAAYALELPLAPIAARMLDSNGSWGGFLSNMVIKCYTGAYN
jgi:hypothetical protein